MSRKSYTGPKLPRNLLDQVESSHKNDVRFNGGGRKAQRKAARAEKKANRVQAIRSTSIPSHGDVKQQKNVLVRGDSAPQIQTSKPLKSILKTRNVSRSDGVEVDNVDDEDDDVLFGEEEERREQQEEEETEVEEEAAAKPVVSRALKARLAEDDDEIAALERKLGMKGKKSQAMQEDGLDWLLEGSDSEDGANNLKRKRPEDSRWLKDKRRKATKSMEQEEVRSSEFDNDEEEVDDDAITNPFSDDEIGSDDLDGFESEASLDVPKAGPKRKKENPYVAPPTTGNASTAKYIPPSLRMPATSDEETLRQLRRQIQGQLNRLSDSNMLSILQAVEELYSKHARQHVTSTLVELLVGLVADGATLNDTFLILHAGFAEAVYKVIGTDFGAQLLEKVVENIDHFHSRQSTSGKQTLNLLAFLSNLYNFQLLASNLLFDYIRLLLSSLSEANTELLLRIIRTSGQQLRKDDPSALKDIVLLLQRSTAEIGEANLSVRMKFMIETINDLKNNRMKTNAAGSALAAEHTARMKKTLVSLTTTRSLRTREPLGVFLSDIRDSEQKGKWWLVGASFHDPSKLASNAGSTSSTKAFVQDPDAAYDSETPGSVNLHRLARQSGFTTPVRRALFIAIMSGSDSAEAHMKILKLHLKRKQMVEIPRVLVFCVGAEEAYNPFYAMVAAKFSGDRGVGKAFQYQLWECLDRIGESGMEEEEAGRVGVKWLVNIGKFFAVLIAMRKLGMSALRKLDPEYAYWGEDMRMFVEVVLTTLLVELWKESGRDDVQYEKAVMEVFGSMMGTEDVVRAIGHALKTVVVKAKLVEKKKEKRAVEIGCRFAGEALERVEDEGIREDGSEDDSD